MNTLSLCLSQIKTKHHPGKKVRLRINYKSINILKKKRINYNAKELTIIVKSILKEEKRNRGLEDCG